MRRIIALLMFVAFVAGAVFISNNVVFAKDKAKEEKKVEEKKVEAKKEELKVVCKFKNKEEMAEFEQIYLAKQATFGRMGVLQAYFTMEQNNLQELDKEMEKKFDLKMDSSKMYDLNRDAMEIREAGSVPQQQAAEQQ